jgi:hypothetical protein
MFLTGSVGQECLSQHIGNLAFPPRANMCRCQQAPRSCEVARLLEDVLVCMILHEKLTRLPHWRRCHHRRISRNRARKQGSPQEWRNCRSALEHPTAGRGSMPQQSPLPTTTSPTSRLGNFFFAFPIARIRKLHHLDDPLFARLESAACSNVPRYRSLQASMAGEADAERVRLTAGPHAGRIGRVVSERRTTLLVHLEGGAEGEKREREREERVCVAACACL